MSLPIVIRSEARDDLNSAQDFYQNRSMRAADRFADEVDAILAKIAMTPEFYPIVFQDVREAPVKRYPFCVFYTIESDHIAVLSIFHTSRDPSIWKGRVS